MTKSVYHFLLALFYVIGFCSLITYIQFNFNLQNFSNTFTALCIGFSVLVSFEDEFFLDRPINFLKKVFNHE